MSNNMNTTPSPTPTTTATWGEQATALVPRIATYIRGKSTKDFTCNFVLADGMNISAEPLTYTRDQVNAFAVDVLDLASPRKDCKDMPEPSSLGKVALAKFFEAKSTHDKVSKFIVIKTLNAYRRELKIARKATRLNAAVTAGTNWFADGVVYRDTHELAGQPRPLVSRRKAVSAYLQLTVGKDWSKQANKGALKDSALAHVRQGSLDAPTAQDNRDAQAALRAPVAPAPVAAVKSTKAKVSKADLVKQAVALGMTKTKAQKMNMARLEATIAVLANL